MALINAASWVFYAIKGAELDNHQFVALVFSPPMFFALALLFNLLVFLIFSKTWLFQKRYWPIVYFFVFYLLIAALSGKASFGSILTDAGLPGLATACLFLSDRVPYSLFAWVRRARPTSASESIPSKT